MRVVKSCVPRRKALRLRQRRNPGFEGALDDVTRQIVSRRPPAGFEEVLGILQPLKSNPLEVSPGQQVLDHSGRACRE